MFFFQSLFQGHSHHKLLSYVCELLVGNLLVSFTPPNRKKKKKDRCFVCNLGIVFMANGCFYSMPSHSDMRLSKFDQVFLYTAEYIFKLLLFLFLTMLKSYFLINPRI